MVGDPVLDSGLGGSREPKGMLPGTWVRSTVRGQDVSREQHRNMYTIKGETDYRPRLDA